MNRLTEGSTAARGRGFTLIELMIVVLIVGVLAAIAYPSYIDYITRSRRAAAEACLSNYADYMERYYATTLSYSMSAGAFSSIGLDCATTQNTGANYGYSLASDSSTAYTIDATPTGVQLTRDTVCGTLQLDQTGARTPTNSACWQE